MTVRYSALVNLENSGKYVVSNSTKPSHPYLIRANTITIIPDSDS